MSMQGGGYSSTSIATNPQPSDFTELVLALRDLVVVQAQLATVLAQSLLAVQSTATSATAGTATALPSAPDGYTVVTIPGAGARKIPFFKV